MGVIKVGNIRTFTGDDGSLGIRVDRKSALGNPYFMKSEDERDRVCDQYERWFTFTTGKFGNPVVLEELYRILNIAKEHDVTLLCWCYPKRCHAETIKKWLDDHLKEEN